MTILLTPFMSCTARLPIYAFFVNAFFPGKGGLIMTGLYVLDICIGILAAFVFKGTLFKGEAVPFVMELPNYRLPGPKNVGQLLWEKAKENVVSTLGILFGGGVSTALTTLSAASLLVFSLLYTPCVAAITTIKRELGGKWAIAVVIWQCVIAWVAALIVRMIGLLF